MVKITPFSTSIYISDIDIDYTDINQEILQHQETDSGAQYSNIGGWQSTSYYVVKHNFINTLFNVIKPKLNIIYNEMLVNSDVSLVNYWFNVNKKFDYNMMHQHAFSYYSAVLYTKTPVNSGNLVFRRPDRLRETVEFKDVNEHNFGIYWTQPEVGKLIIFPSFLEHYVEQNLSDDMRISIAFNFR